MGREIELHLWLPLHSPSVTSDYSFKHRDHCPSLFEKFLGYFKSHDRTSRDQNNVLTSPSTDAVANKDHRLNPGRQRSYLLCQPHTQTPLQYNSTILLSKAQRMRTTQQRLPAFEHVKVHELITNDYKNEAKSKK